MKAADEKKKIRLEKEIERTRGMLVYEERFQEKGLIGGIDEVGRGPLAGPVVAACVILPSDHPVLYLNDSKKLTERKRDELYDVLMEECVSWSVGMESWEVIDEINILQATYSAMRKAIASMDPAPDFLLNDAVALKCGCLKKGGMPDYDKTARVLLDDFRQGRIGRITLDHFHDMKER